MLTTTIYVIFRCIPIVFHCFGIFLLLKVKYIKRYNPTQGFYIIWLSIIEILMNISKISIKLTRPDDLKFHMDVVRTGVLASHLMLVLSAMTIDRACFVVMNLKYRSSWMPEAPRWVLLNGCLLSCAMTTVLFLFCDNTNDVKYAKTFYIWPIHDSVVVLTFVASYTLINVKIKQRAASLQRKQSIRLRRKVKQATKVPQMIVSCFITFWVTSNLVYMAFLILDKKIPIVLAGVLNICICVSYSLDAIFYIYFCRPIRRHLKEKISIVFKRYNGANITEDSSINDEIDEGNVKTFKKRDINANLKDEDDIKGDKNSSKEEEEENDKDLSGITTNDIPLTIYDIPEIMSNAQYQF